MPVGEKSSCQSEGGQRKNTKEDILGRESMYKSMLAPNFSVPIYNRDPGIT